MGYIKRHMESLVLNRSPLKPGPGAVLCLAEQFSAFDRGHFIVPIGMI